MSDTRKPTPRTDLQIRVCGIDDLHRLRIQVPYAAISIRDKERKTPPKLPAKKLLRASLRLAFHDIEPIVGFELPYSFVLMTESDADAIAKFIGEIPHDVSLLLIHCEAERNRSPAVAAAVAEHLGLNHRGFLDDFEPNMWVYRLTSEALSRMKNR